MRPAGPLLSHLAERLRWPRFWRDQRGISATEYGLMIAGFACALLVAMTLVGSSVQARFVSIATKLQSS